MVVGLENFREHFTGHEDQYAIIGGAACDLLFDAAGLPFRATKDLDMVLCVEVVDAAFGEAFKAFLDAGGYEARERSDGKKEFYRFHRPKDKSFPL
jgi:catechol 2,3-dioxygenase-like lactoylglutathione lyase family enzyme